MYEQTEADDPMALLEQSAADEDDIALPAELAQVNETATKKAEDEATSARSSASRVTFVILSVIFVMIQVVGIYFGFAFSYAGKESVKARNYTKNFNSAEELNDWLELKKYSIASQAEAYLQRLREKWVAGLLFLLTNRKRFRLAALNVLSITTWLIRQ